MNQISLNQKRLASLRQQLASPTHPQVISATLPISETSGNTNYLKSDLIRIAIFSTIAIACQIILFLCLRNGFNPLRF